MTADALLPLSVAVPLAGAVAALVLPRRFAAAVGAVASAAAAGTGLAAAAASWPGDGLEHAIGGWSAPLGIVLVGDRLSALMLGMTAVVGLGASLFALGYFAPAETEGGPRFWPMWLLLWAALDGLFLSSDLFNVYVFLELATLAAVGLVAFAGREAYAAALRYLLWALAGSMFYLAGVALLYGATGTLAFGDLPARITPSAAASLGGGMVLSGLALKGALFPLHIWLPQAHASAPAPVSAALSGLVVKTSFYLMLRLAGGAFAPLGISWTMGILGGLGAGAVIWGSALALVQTRLKLLVAYSTVAQLGYLYLALGLGSAAAGLYLALSHAFAKAAMFLSAGVLLRGLDHDGLEDLTAAARRKPVALFAFALAGVSIMGLPPSGGFIGKWLLVESALAAGRWDMLFVVVAGGLASAAYLFRALVPGFAASPAPRSPLEPIELAALALSAAAIALGFTAPVLGLEGS